MKGIYKELNKKEATLFGSIIRSCLIWALIITVIQIYFIIDMNPGADNLKIRIYLFSLCFFSNIILFLLIAVLFAFFLTVLGIKVYREYYGYAFSFIIILANAGFFLLNYIRIGRGDIVDIASLRFMAAGVLSLVLLSLGIIFILVFAEMILSRLSAWHKIIILTLITASGFYVIFRGLAPEQETSAYRDQEIYEPMENSNRVIFLAVDALNFTVLDELFKTDRVPNLKRMHEHGASYSLETIEPAKSPVIWNSIYTSRLPEDHGILDFSMYKMPFFTPVTGKIKFPKLSLIHYVFKIYDRMDITKIIIYNSTHRKARAIWDILSEKSRKSSILGGWVTYPVYGINGTMVSPQYTYCVEDLFIDTQHSLPDVYPAEIDELIRECRLDPGDLTFKDISYYLDISEAEFRDMPKTRLISKNLEMLRWITAQDETFFCISKKLWEKDDYDFMFLYIQQTDVLAHQYWHYFQPEHFPAIDDEEMEVFRDVIYRSYEKADGYIGYFLENYADERTVFIVASDHGMLPTGRFIKSGDHLYGKPEGLMFIYNPEIIKGDETLKKASIYDIAPTILYLLGFPHAEDFVGNVLFDAVMGNILETIPYKKINSYGTWLPGDDKEIDNNKQEEALEHMKSLGYIQ